MENFVVTTNVKTDNNLINEAQKIAKYFSVEYVVRNKATIKELIAKYNNILVVYKNELIFINERQEKLFFHLDTAVVRIKSNNDLLIELIADKEQNILDLTMGLARDSVVMSYYGHKVTALEKNKLIHYIVSNGLKKYQTNNDFLNNAMRQVTTRNIDSYEFLTTCQDNSYDVIYLDPMFVRKIKDSNNLEIFDSLASKDILTEKLFEEITRVAKKKVIIKAHNIDNVFEKFHFKKYERPGAKFSFGVINLEEKVNV